jgi:hypothetical protein
MLGFGELIETNALLLKILKNCEKSVGDYIFSQILYSAKLTQDEYEFIADVLQNPYEFTLTVPMSLN